MYWYRNKYNLIKEFYPFLKLGDGLSHDLVLQVNINRHYITGESIHQ